MLEINKEQLCALASAVTGEQWKIICLEPNGGGIDYIVPVSDPHNILWKPKFNGEDWQQAQALQVVVWTANKIRHDLHRNPNILHGLFIGMLAENDTALLLSLGVELLG